MGKCPEGKAAKRPGLAEPEAGVRKCVGSPGGKKATKDSKQFIDDLFAKPVKSFAATVEKELSGKVGTDKKTKKAAGEQNVRCHFRWILDTATQPFWL